MDPTAKRLERDSMGSMEVPADAYYGASTMRAVLNFPISELRLPRHFLRALGLIKLAAAEANAELGLLESDKAPAIADAAREVAEGKLDDQFVVDVFQTGSGTSTNMNANEVIANRASEMLQGNRQSRSVHPNDQVNLCQSSNDVIPTAIQVAALLLIKEELRPALAELRHALSSKADEFWDVIKTGRTHLQDATPVRLGQEFRGYAAQVERALQRLDYAESELRDLPLGGTAVGTGINCDERFPGRAIEKLGALTGLSLRETPQHFAAQNNIDALMASSGVLRVIALSLMKVGDDIRWMGSGPRAGLGELTLPEVQPGSSIMPGKVNPVIVESLLQAGAQVIGNDTTLVVAARDSHFELNMMLPVAGYNLLQSIALLAASARNFSLQCVHGLQATGRGPQLVDTGLAIGTALAPQIGYEEAAKIAKEAATTGETIFEVAARWTNFSEDELRRILDPRRLVEPGLEPKEPS
jgi:fumarate hydratase, class II